MLKEERQQHILDELYRDGKVNVNELAAHYKISKDTIRRDLNALEERGILKRGYGGAIPYKRIPPAMETRKRVEQGAKYHVARCASQFIHPEGLIAIDGGTTNLLLASLMPLSTRLTVVTNSFPVAEELRKRPKIDVLFLGGYYNKASQTTVGDTVYSQIKGFHFDQLFLGTYCIDPEIGVTAPAPYEDEASVKRLLVKNSSEVNVMAALSKLGTASNYVICKMDQIDRIVCEKQPDENTIKKYDGKIVY